MKYIWIGILLGIEVTWLIFFIIDVISSINYVKNHRQYYNVVEAILYIIDELDDSSEVFIGLHIVILFIISFATWLAG